MHMRMLYNMFMCMCAVATGQPTPTLNRMPLLVRHVVFASLFGLQYVALSWWWLRRTGIVYYPFLDPTLPPARSIPMHAALLLVLAAAFALGAAVDRAAAFLPFAVRAPLLYAAAASLMWTRFIRGRPGELAARGAEAADAGTE